MDYDCLFWFTDRMVDVLDEPRTVGELSWALVVASRYLDGRRSLPLCKDLLLHTLLYQPHPSGKHPAPCATLELASGCMEIRPAAIEEIQCLHAEY
jgi:hypothetical protein